MRWSSFRFPPRTPWWWLNLVMAFALPLGAVWIRHRHVTSMLESNNTFIPAIPARDRANRYVFIVAMTCGACEQAVKNALMDVRGVKRVDVDLNKGTVVVNVETLIDVLPQLTAALESTGRDYKVVNTTDNNNQRTLELTVDPLTCSSCASAITTTLSKLDGVDNVQVNVPNKQVLITGSVFSTAQVLAALEEQGRIGRVVGNSSSDATMSDLHALVVEFKGTSYGHGHVVGVVRAVQTSVDKALVELTLGGLQPSTAHRLTLHEYGDTRRGAETVGRVTNELARFNSDIAGKASVVNPNVPLEISTAIGRGVVVSMLDGSTDVRLAAAVAARSAGINSNDKRVCSCDGTTIWNEKHGVESDLFRGKM